MTPLPSPFQQHPAIVDADRFPSILAQFAEALDFEGGGAITLDPVSFDNLVFPLLPSLCRSRSGVPLAEAKGANEHQRQQDNLHQPLQSHVSLPYLHRLQTDESSKTVPPESRAAKNRLDSGGDHLVA